MEGRRKGERRGSVEVGGGGEMGGGWSVRKRERERERDRRRREKVCVCVWCVWREAHRESGVCQSEEQERERGSGGQTGEEGGRGRNEIVSGFGDEKGTIV